MRQYPSFLSCHLSTPSQTSLMTTPPKWSKYVWLSSCVVENSSIADFVLLLVWSYVCVQKYIDDWPMFHSLLNRLPLFLPPSLPHHTDCGCHPPRQGKRTQIWDSRAAGQNVSLCTWPDPGLWLQNQVWRWQEHWICPHLRLCWLPKEVWAKVQTGTGERGRGEGRRELLRLRVVGGS